MMSGPKEQLPPQAAPGLPIIEKYLKDGDGYSVKIYVCIVCDKEFRQRYLLNRHLPVHTGEKKFTCQVCNLCFSRASTLSRHAARHEKKRAYSCKVCSRQFKRSSTLSEHMKTHQEVKSYECPHCKKAFHQKGNLKTHINVHLGLKPYKCSHCTQMFSQRSNLRQHVTSIHQRAAVYSCNLCSSTYNSQADLGKHEVNDHSAMTPQHGSTSAAPVATTSQAKQALKHQDLLGNKVLKITGRNQPGNKVDKITGRNSSKGNIAETNLTQTSSAKPRVCPQNEALTSSSGVGSVRVPQNLTLLSLLTEPPHLVSPWVSTRSSTSGKHFQKSSPNTSCVANDSDHEENISHPTQELPKKEEEKLMQQGELGIAPNCSRALNNPPQDVTKTTIASSTSSISAAVSKADPSQACSVASLHNVLPTQPTMSYECRRTGLSVTHVSTHTDKAPIQAETAFRPRLVRQDNVGRRNVVTSSKLNKSLLPAVLPTPATYVDRKMSPFVPVANTASNPTVVGCLSNAINALLPKATGGDKEVGEVKRGQVEVKRNSEEVTRVSTVSTGGVVEVGADPAGVKGGHTDLTGGHTEVKMDHFQVREGCQKVTQSHEVVRGGNSELGEGCLLVGGGHEEVRTVHHKESSVVLLEVTDGNTDVCESQTEVKGIDIDVRGDLAKHSGDHTGAGIYSLEDRGGNLEKSGGNVEVIMGHDTTSSEIRGGQEVILKYLGQGQDGQMMGLVHNVDGSMSLVNVSVLGKVDAGQHIVQPAYNISKPPSDEQQHSLVELSDARPPPAPPPTPVCPPPTPVCPLLTPVCPLPTPVCPAPTPVCPAPTPVCPPPTPVCPAPTPVCPPSTPMCPPPTPMCPPSTPMCPPSTPMCPPPTPMCPPPTPMCPPPTPMCPPPTPMCPPPTPMCPSQNPRLLPEDSILNLPLQLPSMESEEPECPPSSVLVSQTDSQLPGIVNHQLPDSHAPGFIRLSPPPQTSCDFQMGISAHMGIEIQPSTHPSQPKESCLNPQIIPEACPYTRASEAQQGGGAVSTYLPFPQSVQPSLLQSPIYPHSLGDTTGNPAVCSTPQNSSITTGFRVGPENILVCDDTMDKQQVTHTPMAAGDGTSQIKPIGISQAYLGVINCRDILSGSDPPTIQVDVASGLAPTTGGSLPTASSETSMDISRMLDNVALGGQEACTRLLRVKSGRHNCPRRKQTLSTEGKGVCTRSQRAMPSNAKANFHNSSLSRHGKPPKQIIMTMYTPESQKPKEYLWDQPATVIRPPLHNPAHDGSHRAAAAASQRLTLRYFTNPASTVPTRPEPVALAAMQRRGRGYPSTASWPHPAGCPPLGSRPRTVREMLRDKKMLRGNPH